MSVICILLMGLENGRLFSWVDVDVVLIVNML